jgi:hypothetical protein
MWGRRSSVISGSTFLTVFFVLAITFCLVAAGIFKANTSIGMNAAYAKKSKDSSGGDSSDGGGSKGNGDSSSGSDGGGSSDEGGGGSSGGSNDNGGSSITGGDNDLKTEEPNPHPPPTVEPPPPPPTCEQGSTAPDVIISEFLIFMDNKSLLFTYTLYALEDNYLVYLRLI